jgi:DNA-directed RNA polymerase beta subunit
MDDLKLDAPANIAPVADSMSLDQPIHVAPDESELRPIDDGPSLRHSVYDKALDAAKRMPPIVGRMHTLRLASVDYADPEPAPTRADETKLLLAKRSLGRRLKGTWQLIDNETDSVIEEKTQTIGNIPHVFDDGSIILRGTRYVGGLQQRLRPGAYVRRRKNGETEVHVNARPGTGPSHRYILEPDTGRFMFNVGHSRVGLVDLLETLGAKRPDIESAWGKEITDVNYAKRDPKALAKMYERLVPKAEQNEQDLTQQEAMREKIRTAFDRISVDDEVNFRTLGIKNGGKMDTTSILRGTGKVLELAKGDIEQDDRDHPAFATYHDMADIISERLEKDYASIRRNMLNKIVMRKGLSSLPSGWLDKQVLSAVYNSGVINANEETNPLETLDRLTRVTRFGEGGLPSITATPDEARAVNPGQFNFVDTVKTSESLRIGVDVNVAQHARLGKDKKLYAPFVDMKTGEKVWRSPDQIADSTMVVGPSAIPGWDMAIVRGKMDVVKSGQGDYHMPHFEKGFSKVFSLAPLKSTMFAQRASMASRMATQALPLSNRETPLVRSVDPESGQAYETLLSTLAGAVRNADEPGTVLDVTPDYIEMAYKGGKKKISIDNYRPTARKTFYHNTAMVKPGDVVQPGQMLAKSNFTDDNGDLALGVNARIALMPYGENWEDAIIISDRLAKRMAVQTAYKHYVDMADGNEYGKKKFFSVFGANYEKDQLDSVDDDGVIKPGTTVKRGDPLVLAMRQRQLVAGRVTKKGMPNYTNASETWEHDYPGVVTHVFKDNKGYNVFVAASKPLEEGDKLSGRQGNKGVVRIMPTEQMPVAEDGDALDMLVSDLSVISRGNTAFPHEAWLGKIAAKTGKRYDIQDFDAQDMREFVKNELKKNNVKDVETLSIPGTNRKIKNINTGVLYVMALHHMSSSKGSAKGIGGYSSSDEPSRAAGSKRVSGQETYALTSQGLYKFQRESSLLRGRRNDDFWAAYMQGHDIGLPAKNVSYDGFLDRLKALGVNPSRSGSKTRLLAMTDDDVDHLGGGRVVTSHDTVDMHKDLAPIPGGLFDPKIFGDGDKFGVMQLDEPALNPVFEEPVRKLLGVTEKDLRDIIGGKKELAKYGSGPQALKQYLTEMDVPAEIARARSAISGTKKVARDEAVKRLGYLKMFERTKLNPGNLMVTKVPVLPPRFRPISRLGGNGTVVVNDMNLLYREMMLANKNLSEMKKYVESPANERLAMYDAFKAMVGTGDPQQYELKSRKVKGLLRQINSDSPKTSYVQRRLLSSMVDNVGRGVILPDTNLDMDTIGLPLNLAMKSFQPYVVRRLVQHSGMPVAQALEHAMNKSESAVRALQQVMQDRPVVMSRAPVLHRYGLLGANAELIPGDAIRLNPFVFKGLGADNDGDTMNFHVPHDKEVVDEIRQRLLPTAMLTMQNDLKSPAYTPQQDHMLGLFYASARRKKNARPRYFKSFKDAQSAFERGDLDADDVVSITER